MFKEAFTHYNSILFTRGVDFLAFETVPSVIEAQAICELLEEEDISVPAWISFSCNSGEHTCHNELFREAVRVAVSSPRVVAVGINCTAPKFVRSLAGIADAEMEHLSTRKHIIAYPNKGERYDADLQKWVPANSEGTIFKAIIIRPTISIYSLSSSR
jgi:homocysteine S-methyltransferase